VVDAFVGKAYKEHGGAGAHGTRHDSRSHGLIQSKLSIAFLSLLVIWFGLLFLFPVCSAHYKEHGVFNEGKERIIV